MLKFADIAIVIILVLPNYVEILRYLETLLHSSYYSIPHIYHGVCISDP